MLGAILALRGKEADISKFLLFGAVCGIMAQMAAACLAGILNMTGAGPAARILMAAACIVMLLGAAVWRTWRGGRMPKINISAYDAGSLLVVMLLGVTLHAGMRELPRTYFNGATDQYYWFAYAERAAHDPAIITSLFMRDSIQQPVFFLLLDPYVSFMPKDFAAYQEFIKLWQYGAYLLSAFAVARLAAAVLPLKAWGLLAPLLMYALHWLNYYMISTDVVPQNIGIFLLIMGFLLLESEVSATAGVAFIAIFYFVHVATCAIFILSVGVGKILTEGMRIFPALWRKKRYQGSWHIFETISFVPTIAVIATYGLYGSGVLKYYPAHLIAYFDEYAKNLTIWDQPYMGTAQNAIIWLALCGLALIPFVAARDLKRRRIMIAAGCGFLLPLVFLRTPIIAYHAFYASWQSFRYFPVMYPSMAVLALVPLATIAAMIAKKTSRGLAHAITAACLIFSIPIGLTLAHAEQKLIILDMITGRDEGALAEALTARLKKLLSISAEFPKGAVLTAGMEMHPYPQWAFAPRPWLIATGPCSAHDCPTYDAFTHAESQIWDAPKIGLGIIRKGMPGEAGARAGFESIFFSRHDDGEYEIYADTRPI